MKAFNESIKKHLNVIYFFSSLAHIVISPRGIVEDIRLWSITER